MGYYHKFKIVIGTPLWRIYLRWAYKRCANDLKKLNLSPNFTKNGFTCLLCGVGNETTADEFIKFIIQRSSNPKIFIIDIGEEQVRATKKLVTEKYPTSDIKIKKIDALRLNSFFEPNTIDWVETDGFLEYFNHASLEKLLQIWERILAKDGFITTRDCASEGKIDQAIDSARIWLGKVWLGITLYPHEQQELRKLFTKCGFRYFEGPTFLPTFKRFSLIKK